MTAELQAQPLSSPPPAPDTLEANVSGVFVATDKPSPIGSVLTLDLRFSDAIPAVRALVRVEYVVDGDHAQGRQIGMGVSFLDVWGARAAEQLTQYLLDAERSGPERSWMAGARVLVVDDNARYRELAAQSMREAGFDVLLANNGFEALSMALKHQPSLLLTDVTMPGMDGFQLLRLLRGRPELRRMPVMFLTELDNEADRLRGYELGVDDYVNKPFTPVELITRVERVLERAAENSHAAMSGMRGDLSKVPLASLLAFSEMERRMGVLQLTRDGETATLYLRDGAVMRIDLAPEHDHLQGIERLFHILDWNDGRFELTSDPVRIQDTLELPTTYVLLEHARRHDEQRR